jgi:two-component system CitB family sensor kinase
VRTRPPREWSLAEQLFAMQAAIIVVVVVGALAAAYSQAYRQNLEETRDKVLAVAESVAAAPSVSEALHAPNPSARLQPFAEEVRRDTGTDFVVVMTVQGIRYTHPNLREIGRRFQGTIAPAVGGRSFTETFTGTLGPSVRAVVPVKRDGSVTALVSVGITLSAVGREFRQQVPLLFGAAGVALLLAGIGSWLASRWLKRTTHDLGPAELSRMYEYYDAVLHAVREGLLLLDRSGRLQLVNDEARRLLVLPDDAVGRRIDDVGLPPQLGADLAAGGQRSDELYLTGDRVVVVSQATAKWAGKRVGTVVTLRDHTELRALTTELNTIRGFADSLHAQAHEAANQLHTVVSLIELGRTEEALQFAASELAVAQQLTDRLVGTIDEPALAALLLGKVAQGSERGVELVVAEDTELPPGVADPRDLVTIVGNLLDNAVDAAAAAPPPRRVEFASRLVGAAPDDPAGHVLLRVADTGPGLDPADVERAFQRGWSTKPDQTGTGRGLGLALVAQAVYRYGGTIEVSREQGAVFTVRLPIPHRAGRPGPGGGTSDSSGASGAPGASPAGSGGGAATGSSDESEIPPRVVAAGTS